MIFFLKKIKNLKHWNFPKFTSKEIKKYSKIRLKLSPLGSRSNKIVVIYETTFVIIFHYLKKSLRISPALKTHSTRSCTRTCVPRYRKTLFIIYTALCTFHGFFLTRSLALKFYPIYERSISELVLLFLSEKIFLDFLKALKSF